MQYMSKSSSKALSQEHQQWLNFAFSLLNNKFFESKLDLKNIEIAHDSRVKNVSFNPAILAKGTTEIRQIKVNPKLYDMDVLERSCWILSVLVDWYIYEFGQEKQSEGYRGIEWVGAMAKLGVKPVFKSGGFTGSTLVGFQCTPESQLKELAEVSEVLAKPSFKATDLDQSFGEKKKKPPKTTWKCPSCKKAFYTNSPDVIPICGNCHKENKVIAYCFRPE
jgi:hypothetical protein